MNTNIQVAKIVILCYNKYVLNITTMTKLAERKPDSKELHRGPDGATSQLLGRAGLSGVEVSAGHFYGGDGHLIARTFDGEHRVLVGRANEAGGVSNEAVGVGDDVEAALQDSLERMRTLETVRTHSLARIEMTGSSFASFTSLEHYSPKVAPSRDIYPVPSYLETTLTDSESGDDTYQNTIAETGWQSELISVLADYLDNDPGGQQLVENLKIRSLSHLTPEQAVKLSAAFVQNVSSYTYEDAGSNQPTRADQSTAPELLKEGVDNRRDPNWAGNGVCRNVASNVKAVFEALKRTQAELSMLNNTYCVYGGGEDGVGYADSRSDSNSTMIGKRSGHAWNTFATIDSEGSVVATIIDATWALDKDTSSAIEHLDRTEIRAAAQLMQLFEESEVKPTAFSGLTSYVQRLIITSHTNQQLGDSARVGIREYVTTAYLNAATMLPEIPEGFTLPDTVVSSAYQFRDKLDHREIATLFALDKAGGGFEQERIKLIVAGYDGKRKVPIPDWKSAENLVFNDDDLQQLAYSAVGAERTALLAERSGKFRARLRELQPEALPPFNATESPEDAEELSYFAGLHGIHSKDPKIIMNKLRNRLKKLAGGDSVYKEMTAGLSDYEIAKEFVSIASALGNRGNDD